MASPYVAVNAMVPVPEKKTTSVDLFKPIRQYIVENYTEHEAVENEDDLRMVQQMRHDVEKAHDSLESRKDLLQRYYKALCMMESRFPISNERKHIHRIYFTWYDAFKTGRKASQQNIHFEKASVVFNLGAVHSQIAYAADRTDPHGIKQACNSFQAAAGAFAFLRDNISLKASGNNNNQSTVDISVECAGMLERLMLAQAQECFFEKAVSDKKPSALCAKLARQVGLYYEEAHAALVNTHLNQHFDRAWTAHIQVKAAQYHGEACYRIALDLHEKDEIAEEIARLSVATDVLGNAKRSGRGATNQLLDAVSRLEANVNLNLEQARKENDRVYLMRVPPISTLPPLPAASLVKPLNLSAILDASNERIFASIVPDSSTKALSRYSDMLDDIVRSQTEKLQKESEFAKTRLKEMDILESLHVLEGCCTLPAHLKNDVEAVQLNGGPTELHNKITQLKDLRRVNHELLTECEEILKKEAQEDSDYRAQYGNSWARPQSVTLTKNFHERMNSFSTKLQQAADMDSRVERLIHENWDLMSILNKQPIESALPTLGKQLISLNGEEGSVVAALKQSLVQLENLGTERAKLEDMLKEMKEKENILPKLMTTTGSYEDLFKKELAKYEQISTELDRNIDAQRKLLQKIQTHKDAYAAVFNLQDFKASQDRTINQITAAVAKYKEIRDTINNSGIKFYISLQDAINNLKQQCSDYAMTRGIQSRDMIEDIQAHMSELSMSGTPPPSNPPQRTGVFFSLFPFHQSHQQPRQTSPSHNYSQPPYPGWQGPYYNTGLGNPADPAQPHSPHFNSPYHHRPQDNNN